jgi:hypothetical protein
MATQPKTEPSTDDAVLTRLGGVEAQLTDVKTRLTGVETRLGVVEVDLAVVKSNYATKEDIAKLHEAIAAGDHSLELKMAQMETRLIKWFIATAITLAGVSGSLAFLAARFIH